MILPLHGHHILIYSVWRIRKSMVHNHHCEGHRYLFKLDTGAEMTVMLITYWGKQLNAADKILCGPSRHSLCVMGKFECDPAIKGKVTKARRYLW